MRAVSNTSPLSNLARLDLLKRRYGEVRIPPAVAAELSQLNHPVARTRLAEALAEGWMIVAQLPNKPAKLAFPLDPGETQAIAPAVDLRADTRSIETTRGVLTYSQLAPLLAERVLHVEHAIGSGAFASQALASDLLRQFHREPFTDSAE